jgi:hypothetical protein
VLDSEQPSLRAGFNKKNGLLPLACCNPRQIRQLDFGRNPLIVKNRLPA